MKIDAAVKLVAKEIEKTLERPMEAIRRLWKNHLHSLDSESLTILAQQGLMDRVSLYLEGKGSGSAMTENGTTFKMKVKAVQRPKGEEISIYTVRFSVAGQSIPLADFEIKHWKELESDYAAQENGFRRKRGLASKAMKLQEKFRVQKFSQVPEKERALWWKEWISE